MGILWNEAIAMMEIVAKSSRDILQHEKSCQDLITMFVVYFGYDTQPKDIRRRIDTILTEFYMGVVERSKSLWKRTTKEHKARTLKRLSNEVIFAY